MNDKAAYGIISAIIVILIVSTIIIFNRSEINEDVTAKFVSGTEYSPWEFGQIIVELRDKDYNPINATCDVSILYPDKSYFVDHVEMNLSTVVGTQYYEFVVPDIEGVYEYSVNCTYGSKSYAVGKSFHVTNNYDPLILNNTYKILDAVTRQEYWDVGNPYSCTYTSGNPCSWGNNGIWNSGQCAAAGAPGLRGLYYFYENYTLENSTCKGSFTWNGQAFVNGVDNCSVTIPTQVFNPSTLVWDDFYNITYNFQLGFGGKVYSPIYSTELPCLYFDAAKTVKFRYEINYRNLCGGVSTDYTGWCESSINVTSDVIRFVQDLWALAQVEAEGSENAFKGELVTNGWRMDMGFGSIANMTCNQPGNITIDGNRAEISWVPDDLGNVELSCNLSILPRYYEAPLSGVVKQYVRVSKGLGAWAAK